MITRGHDNLTAISTYMILECSWQDKNWQCVYVYNCDATDSDMHIKYALLIFVTTQ